MMSVLVELINTKRSNATWPGVAHHKADTMKSALVLLQPFPLESMVPLFDWSQSLLNGGDCQCGASTTRGQ